MIYRHSFEALASIFRVIYDTVNKSYLEKERAL